MTLALQLPSDAELVGRILLAALLGGLIGLERDLADHPAGLRTHISVALGAALFGVVSGYGFSDFDASRAVTNFQVDPTRVASNIVTGVGFLGGGAIIKYGATVKGLTTAASLWVTAAIGLGCALGSYLVSVVTTAVLLLALFGLRAPRRWLTRRLAEVRETVIITMAPGADPSEVVTALSEVEGVRIATMSVQDEDDAAVIRAQLSGVRGERLDAVLTPLRQRPDVEELEVT